MSALRLLMVVSSRAISVSYSPAGARVLTATSSSLSYSLAGALLLIVASNSVSYSPAGARLLIVASNSVSYSPAGARLVTAASMYPASVAVQSASVRYTAIWSSRLLLVSLTVTTSPSISSALSRSVTRPSAMLAGALSAALKPPPSVLTSAARSAGAVGVSPS